MEICFTYKIANVESSVMRSYHKTTLQRCAVELHENLDIDDVMSHMISKEISDTL